MMGGRLWITKGRRSRFEIAMWLGLALVTMLVLGEVVVGMASVFRAHSPHPGGAPAAARLDPPQNANCPP